MSIFGWFFTGVFSVVAFTLFIMWAQASSRKAARNAAEDWMGKNRFTQYRIIFDTGDAIGVDYDSKRVGFFAQGKASTVSFSQLVSVETTEDGQSISKASRGSQLAGAALGGLAFGGAGAVVGAMGASANTQHKINRSSIAVITTDRDLPFLEINVYQGTPLEKNGFTYKQLTANLMPWFGRLKAILEQES